MDRLTFDGNFCDIAQCMELPCRYEMNCSQKQTWERLKAYEDTKLTPEEIQEMRYDLAVYRDEADPLLDARNEGRLVLLPEKFVDPEPLCEKCIHESACRMWCSGRTMAHSNAGNCPCYETAHSCAAYLIGKMEAEAAQEEDDEENG